MPRVANPPPLSDLVNLPGDLQAVEVPKPPEWDTYVADNEAAIRLGKALFWDMQVGDDGVQACASCHFRAGADPRSKNQMAPELNKVPAPSFAFFKGGPNYQPHTSDWPLTKLLIPGVRGEILPDEVGAFGSQGIHLPAGAPDDLGYEVGGIHTRRVTPRNAPSVINAVFNSRQFWDGRAEGTFNGVDHRGDRNDAARVVKATTPTTLAQIHIHIHNASLASQALAPPISVVEMANPGTRFSNIAHRLLPSQPLAKQEVHPHDSVLGAMSLSPNPGLVVDSYETMFKQAFKREWWDSEKLVQVYPSGAIRYVYPADANPDAKQYTLMEYNFGLMFGLALQAYESTLVSDQTPWDKFRRLHPSPDDPALNPWTNETPEISRFALFGAHLFNDRSRGPTNVRCSNCHESSELTDASSRRVAAAADGPVRNRDGNVIDKGFNNIGIRPTTDDLGVGGSDDFGPLSATRRLFPDAPPADFGGAPVSKGFGVEGAFKIPSLRNVALTGPYFHNGDMRTLKEVVEFYSRGGNVAPILQQDGTVVEPLGVPALNSLEVSSIVAFLQTLTDDRVVYQQAPFDHPELFIPNGHPGGTAVVNDDDGDGLADDAYEHIPAVGAEGGPTIPGFLKGRFGP